MRVFMQALGCRLNEAELERWADDCRRRGYRLADDPATADLVIINTCAVTGESARKSRQLIRRAQRRNPRAKLVVSGCYASLAPIQTAAEQGVDLVVPNTDKDRLIELASSRLALPVMPQIATEPGENALLSRGRHRAFVKVQDGCRYRCSYCIVTAARGDERSRTEQDIVRQINRVHAAGINEVVLAGVHLGGYGSDLGSNLKTLIKAVLDGTDIPRLRLGSLEPWDLPTGFWQLFEDRRLMPHLHLPLQSGADSVLRRMSRRCRGDEFSALVTDARRAVPGFNVTTDIIVGFPGETAAEWRQTLEFAAEQRFGHIHIFAYSPRSGTKAATMPDPVPEPVKRERCRQLHELAEAARQEILRTAVGGEFDVLVEGERTAGDDGPGMASGYTENYLRVELDQGANTIPANTIARVRATGLSACGGRLRAESV